jgi:hypothetical protein
LQRYFLVIDDKGIFNDFQALDETETFSVRDSFRQWFAAMKGSGLPFDQGLNHDPFIALLLILLPDIEMLDWGVSFEGWKWPRYFHSSITGVFKTAGKLQRKGLSNNKFSLSNLREINLTFSKNIEHNIEHLAPFLEIPSVQRFACRNFTGIDDSLPYLYVAHPNQITHLSMLNYRFYDTCVVSFSENWRCLRELEITYSCLRAAGHRDGFRLNHVPGLVDNIIRRRATLRRLVLLEIEVDDILHEKYNQDGLFGKTLISSLSHLTNLKYLEIQEFMFDFKVRDSDFADIEDGSHLTCTEGHRFRLNDLPPKLEELVIRDVEMSLSGRVYQLLGSPADVKIALPQLRRMRVEFAGREPNGIETKGCVAKFKILQRQYQIIGVHFIVERMT